MAIIEERSASLKRFLQAYQRLLKLPPPVLRSIHLAELVGQVTQLETRLKVHIDPGPEILFLGDPDQIQQALINLIQNAAEQH